MIADRINLNDELDHDGELEFNVYGRYAYINKEQAEHIIEHLQSVFGLKQEAASKKHTGLLKRAKTLLSLINMNGQLRSGESVSLYRAIEKELENPGEQP